MKQSFCTWGERAMRWVFSSAIVVVPGLLILAFFASPDLGHGPARTTTARTDVHTLHDSVRLHKRLHGRLPAGLADLTVPDANGRRIVETLPHDPWGAAYVLRATSRRAGFEVLSAGPDGKLDTDDDVSSSNR